MTAFGNRSWDSLCRRCGLCCCEKHNSYIDPKGRRTAPAVSGRYYINLDEPCPHLNKETKECDIYERRLRLCRECGRLTIFHAVFASYLPRDCAYVQKYSIWRTGK